jgi:hypothetical protein
MAYSNCYDSFLVSFVCELFYLGLDWNCFFVCRLPEIQYVSPRPPKEDSQLHRLARAGDQAAILDYVSTHGTDNIDELNAGIAGVGIFKLGNY